MLANLSINIINRKLQIKLKLSYEFQNFIRKKFASKLIFYYLALTYYHMTIKLPIYSFSHITFYISYITHLNNIYG